MVWEPSAYRWYLKWLDDVRPPGVVWGGGRNTKCKARTQVSAPGHSQMQRRNSERNSEGDWRLGTRWEQESLEEKALGSGVAPWQILLSTWVPGDRIAPWVWQDGSQDKLRGVQRLTGQVERAEEKHCHIVTYFCLSRGLFNMIWWQNKMFNGIPSWLFFLLCDVCPVSNFYCYQHDWNEQLCKLSFLLLASFPLILRPRKEGAGLRPETLQTLGFSFAPILSFF